MQYFYNYRLSEKVYAQNSVGSEKRRSCKQTVKTNSDTALNLHCTGEVKCGDLYLEAQRPLMIRSS